MTAFAYQPFYCEENIWHLAGDARVGEGERAVLFISNPAATVALWSQCAGGDDGLVVWDYHVVLVVRGPNGAHIWDLDSSLGLPCEAGAYLRATFRSVAAPFAPHFRWIEANTFRARFGSDRRHMRDPAGQYVRAPPQWPPIGDGHRLPEFVGMDPTQEPGEVLDLPGLRLQLGL